MRYFDEPEPLTVLMRLEVSPGETRDTLRLGGQLHLNARAMEMRETLLLGTSFDVRFEGSEVVMQVTANPMEASHE